MQLLAPTLSIYYVWVLSQLKHAYKPEKLRLTYTLVVVQIDTWASLSTKSYCTLGVHDGTLKQEYCLFSSILIPKSVVVYTCSLAVRDLP